MQLIHELSQFAHCVAGVFVGVWSFLRSHVSLEFVDAFGGAFFGALAAFVLEGLRRHFVKKTKRHEALLAAQSVILVQRNSLLNFKAQTKGEENPFTGLGRLFFSFSAQSIDFSELAFLATEKPRLILELDVAQIGYQSAVETARVRNAFVDEFLKHPNTVITDIDPSTREITASADKRMKFDLAEINRMAWETMQHASAKNREAFQSLQEFTRKKFPRKKHLPFGPDARTQNKS
jgi:hypothetical protein